MLPWIKAFNPFDPSTQGDAKSDAGKEGPFYHDRVEACLPEEPSVVNGGAHGYPVASSPAARPS